MSNNKDGFPSRNNSADLNDLYNDLPQELVNMLKQTHPDIMKDGGQQEQTEHLSRLEIKNQDRNIMKGQTQAQPKSQVQVGFQGQPKEPVQFETQPKIQAQIKVEDIEKAMSQDTNIGSIGYFNGDKGSKAPSSRDDVSEVREARMQQVGQEINQIKNTPEQKGDPTQYAVRSKPSNNMNIKFSEQNNVSKEVGSMANEEEYTDGIKFVSVMPARHKYQDLENTGYPNAYDDTESSRDRLSNTQSSRTSSRRKKNNDVSEETSTRRRKNSEPSQETSTRKRKNSEPSEETSTRRNKSKNKEQEVYPDLDFDELEKQEQLRNLYDDDEDDDYYEEESIFSGKEKIIAFFFAIGIIGIAFLGYKTMSLSTALEKAQLEVTNNLELSSKFEELQLENMNLKEQVSILQGGSANLYGDESASTSESTEESSAEEEGVTVYTVVSGDNGWSIAQKVYGDGSRYPEILAANGLGNNATITVGMKLTIPR